MKIDNVNFRKSVVSWANSGGDVTSEYDVDQNNSRSHVGVTNKSTGPPVVVGCYLPALPCKAGSGMEE